MTDEEARNIIEDKKPLLKDSKETSFIYNIDGVDRYFTGWALLDDEIILYMRATEEELNKGREMSARVELSKFLQIVNKEEESTDQ